MSAKSNNIKICCFCGLTEDNELELGKFYEHDDIVTHYYCLLLSAKMEQKGNDNEGILGFLVNDIKKELRRGKRLTCSYCKKSGATLGCCNTKCKRMFHYPCGLRAGTLNQFFGEFRSYCKNHRPKQKIDGYAEITTKQHNDSFCYICYDKINLQDLVETLWAPCCKKDAWFHRKCVQQLAMNAGYFFKCPLCNNNKEFQNEMLQYGIFIPSQDASWELEPNAFQELLYRHNRCDAVTCLCPKGRNHTSLNAKWELTLCRTCGSQGIHMACGQLKWAKPIWDCDECVSILGKVKKSTNLKSETINITNYDTDANSSDSEISVGGTQDKDDLPMSSYSYIRPGPLSYKLQKAKAIKSTTSIICKDYFASTTQNISVTSTPEMSSSLNLQRNKSTDTDNICSSSKDENVETNRKQSLECTQQPISSDGTSATDMIIIDDNDDDAEIVSSETLKKMAPASFDKGTKINNLNQSGDISCKASSSIAVHKETTATDEMSNSMNNVLSIENRYINSENIEAIQKSEDVVIDDTQNIILSRSKDHIDIDNSSLMNINITNVKSLSLNDYMNLHDLKNTNNDTISPVNTKPLIKLDNSKDSKIKSTRSQSLGGTCNESGLGSKRKYEANICIIGTYTNGIKTLLINKRKKIKENDVEQNMKDSSNAITCNKANLQNKDPINIQSSPQEIKNGNVNMDQQIKLSNSIKNKISNKNSTKHTFSSMLETTNHNIAEGKINNNELLIPDQSTSKGVIVPNILYNNTFESLSINEDCIITKVMPSQNLDDVEVKSRKCSIVKQCDGDANTSYVGESTDSHATTEGDRSIPQGESAAAEGTNLLQCAAHRASVSDEPYISISSSSKSSTCRAFSEIASNPNTCDKPRLIPKAIPLQDLKFKVRDSNNLQMTLYDTFSVNIQMNAAMESQAKDSSTSTGVCNMRNSLLCLDDKSTVATCSRIQHSYNSHLTSNNNKRTAGTVVSKNVIKHHADVKENFNPVTKTTFVNVSNNFSIVNVFDDKCQLMTR